MYTRTPQSSDNGTACFLASLADPPLFRVMPHLEGRVELVRA
jgi:hypothetical protein